MSSLTLNSTFIIRELKIDKVGINLGEPIEEIGI